MPRRKESDVVAVVVRGLASSDRKVPFSSYITPRARDLLRDLAYEARTDQVALVSEALNLLFAKHRKPQVA